MGQPTVTGSSLTGSARVSTTRLEMIVVGVDDAGGGVGGAGDLVDVAPGGQADGYRKLRVVSIRVKLGILSSL